MPVRIGKGGLMTKFRAAASALGSSLSEAISSDGSSASRGVAGSSDSSGWAGLAGQSGDPGGLTSDGLSRHPPKALPIIPSGDSPRPGPCKSISSHGTPAGGSVHLDVAGSASEADTEFFDDQFVAEQSLQPDSGRPASAVGGNSSLLSPGVASRADSAKPGA